jgi:hypothetical protein
MTTLRTTLAAGLRPGKQDDEAFLGEVAAVLNFGADLAPWLDAGRPAQLGREEHGTGRVGFDDHGPEPPRRQSGLSRIARDEA